MMHMGIVDRDSLNVKTKCHLEFIRDFLSRLNDKCGFQVQFPVGLLSEETSGLLSWV